MSARAMCRPSGTRLIRLILPGTDVPGSRLFRPCGTCSLPSIEQILLPWAFTGCGRVLFCIRARLQSGRNCLKYSRALAPGRSFTGLMQTL